MTERSVAVVSGGNRGIGREVCRQLAAAGHLVFLGCRDLAAGTEVAAEIRGDVRALRLDVTSPDSVEGAIARVADEVGRLDVLVNNAAVHYDDWQLASGADLSVVGEALDTNLLGAWRLTLSALPLLRSSDHPRVVNVSSGAGALAGMGGGVPAYKVSKVGLNALTSMLAAELRRDGVLVNSVCPGWVATDMGGAGGRPVEEGAAGIVWAATLPDDGPSGGFFRDGQPIDW